MPHSSRPGAPTAGPGISTSGLSAGARGHSDEERFPRWVRVVLYFAGWLLLLLGFAALFLPGPGLLGMAAGAAVLSIASEALHERLRAFLARAWPEGAEHLDHFRDRAEAWINRLHRR